MEVSFSATVWKYALLTANIFISIMGTVFIQCGVVALGCAGSVHGAYIVTAIGVVVLGICFLGCWASLRESYLMSFTFVVITVVIIVIEIIAMIAFAIMKESLLQDTSVRIDAMWQKEDEFPGSMESPQILYECCGKDSPQDYLQENSDILPASCCVHGDCSKTDNIHVRGCSIAAVTFFNDQSDCLILTTVALIALEVLGVVSAYYLAKCVKNRKVKKEQIIISSQ